MNAKSILIVEDEHALGSALALLVRRSGHLPTLVASGEAGLKSLGEAHHDAVILDIGLPDVNGLDVLETLRQSNPDVPVMVITAHATLQHAIDSQKFGATAYFNKPLDLEKFSRHLDALLAPTPPMGAGGGSPVDETESPTFIGGSPCLCEVFVGIAKAASSDLPVLLSGAGGSGKSLVARVIHAHGRSPGSNLNVVSCASLDSWSVDEGWRGSTLILDGLHELETGAQGALASWLPDAADMQVRVIAITRDDPQQAVREGSLREDLYYVLSPLHICLPPLRERSGDIPAMCGFFGSLKLKGGSPVISPPVMTARQAHDWPGNVRELRHVLDYALSLSRGGPVFMSHLPDSIQEVVDDGNGMPASDGELEAVIQRWIDRELAKPEELKPAFDDLMAQLEAMLLRELMERHDHKPTALASALKLHRGTLRQKLQRAGLQRKKG